MMDLHPMTSQSLIMKESYMQVQSSPTSKALRVVILTSAIATVAALALSKPEPSVVSVAQLKSLSSIPTVSGSADRTVHVFISADCGYCKEFEEVLGSMPNLRVHRYLLPAHAAAGAAATGAVWCAGDQIGAWRKISAGEALPPASCSLGAVERNAAAARRFGISMTPAVIAGNGSLREGYMDAEELERFLSANTTE
jgi:thiol:disulfide interchange protein DsbC